MKHGTQILIAKKAGITSSMLSQILNGKKRAGWRTAKSLALATNTDPVLWLEGSLNQIRDTIEIITKESQDLAS